MMNVPSRSRSIPILQSSDIWQERLREEQEAKMTDHQDYLFYNRVVSGIKKQQKKTKDANLRIQNQAVIDHINYTRHCQSPRLSTNFVPRVPSVNPQLEYLRHRGVWLALPDTTRSQAEEDMIFEIDT
eukprot:scaffold3437_cov113-Cylindrotheca_fusiformis.AAC.5